MIADRMPRSYVPAPSLTVEDFKDKVEAEGSDLVVSAAEAFGENRVSGTGFEKFKAIVYENLMHS